MKLSDLKNMMMLANEEIVLNKTILIRGVKVHFMSITRQDDKNTIWAVYENKNTIHSVDLEDVSESTNRDSLYDSTSNKSYDSLINIRKFTIQGEEFDVSSSSSSNVMFNNMDSIMKLQHFYEAKLLPSFLDDTNINDICIASFTQREDEKFPMLDLSKEIDMSVLVGFNHKSFLVNKTLKVGFDNTYTGEYTFYNPLTSKECSFYLQPLELYDIWEETRLLFESDKFKDFPKEQIDQMKKASFDSLEAICPKDKKLALLKYETDDDISLNFYSKEYLDTKVIRNSSSSAVIFSADEKIGPNGLKNKICKIKALNEEELSDIDIELFSFTITLAEFSVSSSIEEN